ncbi:hypothetical protein K1719_020306 [Acacia pycnantha]|nr:hypothetical protein K1719_020306 [Acacia pycnantha]
MPSSPHELSFVSAEKVLLSPQKVMLAMSDYIPNFNLTSQQDAAEAFNHLLCSLTEEFGDSYTPKVSSLADSVASNCRILTPEQRVWPTERERWQQLFLGPFDGILGSTLTCQSCSSQISLSFESFDCLPLSTVHTGGSAIPLGHTLVDCLKQFIVAEHVENYHCSHCWHNAAIKYLSLMGRNETEIDELNRCSKEEFCNCRRLNDLEKLPWSNRFSHTLKQPSIARCPRNQSNQPFSSSSDLIDFTQVELRSLKSHFMGLRRESGKLIIGFVSEHRKEVDFELFLKVYLKLQTFASSRTGNNGFLKKYLPIDPSTNDLFEIAKDGVLLCKLINVAVPGTIDEHAINKKRILNPWERNENHTLCLNSTKAIGCTVDKIPTLRCLVLNLLKVSCSLVDSLLLT